MKELSRQQTARIIFLLKEAVEDVELGRKPNPLYWLFGGRQVTIRGNWANEAKGVLSYLEMENEIDSSLSVKASVTHEMTALSTSAGS